MDIQTLRIFVAVAREGSLSRAADKLALTQPAVSLQIKGLQAATGLTLFKRSAQGMNLTRDGAALLPLAEKVLAAHRNSLRTIILPKRNKMDLDDIPDEIKKVMTFVYADTMDDVLAAALEPIAKPKPSSKRKKPAAKKSKKPKAKRNAKRNAG